MLYIGVWGVYILCTLYMCVQTAAVWSSDSTQSSVHVVHSQRRVVDLLLHSSGARCFRHRR